MSNDSWHRAIRAGALLPIHRHVARLPGTPTTTTQRIAAAVLAAGPGAMASHRSAAHLWGIDEPDDEMVDLILADRRRHVDLDGVVVHRPTDRLDLVPQRRDNVACTNVLRTLCDLGAVAPEAVFDAVGRALDQRLASIGALQAAVVRHARPGRAGVPALRSAISAWMIDERPADSFLELAFRDFVVRYALPPVVFHERIEGWEIDFRFVDTAIIVEIDGFASHGRIRSQFERDRRKDTQLVAAGWHVLRFTYRSIVDNPVGAAVSIRRALARWAHLDVPSIA
jgi:very-short-patch-repair endonuclease